MKNHESTEYMVVGNVRTGDDTHLIYFHKKPEIAIGEPAPKGAMALAQVRIHGAAQPSFTGEGTFEDAEEIRTTIVSFFQDFDEMEGRGESAPFHIAFEFWGIAPSEDDCPETGF